MPVLYKRCVCRTCISYFISNLDVEETLVRTCVRLSASHITFSSHSVVTGDLNPWPLVPFLIPVANSHCTSVSKGSRRLLMFFLYLSLLRFV